MPLKDPEARKAYDRMRGKLPHRKERSRQYDILTGRDRKRVLFRGKSVRLKINPRTGICSECGRSGRTEMHHDQYDETDPLAHTRELCTSCHDITKNLKDRKISSETKKKHRLWAMRYKRDPRTGRFI